VVVIFLGLVATVELIELLVPEGRIVVAGIARL
jgi:hypothetical protein